MACPHKSIPSPRSSRAPPWRVPINQCHCPIPASVAHPHKSVPSPRPSQCHEAPSIKPIGPIKPGSRAPMARPYESVSSPQSCQCPKASWYAPMNQPHRPDPGNVACPHESIPSPWSSQCRVSPCCNPAIGECAVLLISGLRISALPRPPPGFTHKPVLHLTLPPVFVKYIV